MTDTQPTPLPHGVHTDAATWNAAPAPVREIVLRHAADATHIQHLFDIEQHLIEEVHHKKGVHKRTRYQLFPSVQHHYKVTLFKKHTEMTSFDAFPSAIKSTGEDRLYAELNAHPEWQQHCRDLYRYLPETDVTAWDLEAIGNSVSPAEEQTFQRYLQLYRAMFEKYSAHGDVFIVKEHRRLARIFGWPVPAMPRTPRR